MNEPTTSGGSNATDFQPPTGNPQADVNGSLQPNSANLQPITTSNGSNVFDQPGINPQAFPKTDSLRVLSSGTKAPNPSTLGVQTDTNSGLGWGTLTLFFVVTVALLALILLIAKTAKPSTKAPDKLNTEPTITKPAKSANKKKSGPKKKKTKRRK